MATVVVGLSILATTMWTARSEAQHCHIFSVWHYKTPQHCNSIRYAHGPQKQLVPDLLPPERTEIELPSLDFTACPEGDERLRGIALLRGIANAP